MVDVRFETCVVFGGGKETATPLLLILVPCWLLFAAAIDHHPQSAYASEMLACGVG